MFRGMQTISSSLHTLGGHDVMNWGIPLESGIVEMSGDEIGVDGREEKMDGKR